MTEYSRLIQAAVRQDLPSFIYRAAQTVSPGSLILPNWHIEAMAWHLNECLEGRIKRLIITVPPRSLKSISGSVAFPAYVLGRDPTRKIICVSYSKDLTLKHSRDCRAVMGSDWYRKAFPNSWINPAKGSEVELITKRLGSRLGTSVGGTLTGRGGDFIIIDDPMKPADAYSQVTREGCNQWFDNTLYSRLDSKTDGVIILIMQRLHTDDLVAHVMEQEGWVHLNLPAVAEIQHPVRISDTEIITRPVGHILHPEREPLVTLDQVKSTLGAATFAAQYQQSPVPPGGLMVKEHWFRIYDGSPPRKAGDMIVQSWDTASKAAELNDYSVCTTWYVQGKDYYLMDVYRARLEYPDLRRAVVHHARQYAASTILIEDMGAGIQLIQDIRSEQDLRPIAFRPEGDKQTRLYTQTSKIEGGQVLLPKAAPWRGDFLAEILSFPNGRHDDQVDSLTQFLTWIETRNRGEMVSFQIRM